MRSTRQTAFLVCGLAASLALPLLAGCSPSSNAPAPAANSNPSDPNAAARARLADPNVSEYEKAEIRKTLGIAPGAPAPGGPAPAGATAPGK